MGLADALAPPARPRNVGGDGGKPQKDVVGENGLTGTDAVVRQIFTLILYTPVQMSGRRNPKPPAASTDLPSPSSLAAHMGNLGVGSPAAASESDALAAPAPAAVPDSPAAGRKGKGNCKGNGGGAIAGPSSTTSSAATLPSSAALVATDAPKGAPSSEVKSGGENDSKACAGCGAVGKCFRCSRCRLVFYCSKDCQASEMSNLRRKLRGISHS